MKLPSIKKLDNRGVAHHALIALIVVVSIASFGAWRVWSSSAATVSDSYLIRVTNEKGCELAGRKWDVALNDCTNTCRTNAGVYKTVIGSDGKPKGFCSLAVAETMSAEECTLTLHRYYVYERGCAKRVDGDNTNNAKQCLPGYPNYIAEAGKDKCVVATIAPPTTTTDAISAEQCAILGRTFDSSKNVCNRTCIADSGTLLLGATSKQYFCNKAVQTDMSQARCNELHRKWLTDGCARRTDQADTNNAVQCVTGYPYYNANFTAAGSSTATDVCESSKAAAISSESKGTPGAASTAPAPANSTSGGSSSQPSSTSGSGNGVSGSSGTSDQIKDELAQASTCKKTRIVNGTIDCESDPVVTQASADASTMTVDTGTGEKRCELLGRLWVPAAKKAKAGCSTEKCFKTGVTMKSSNGKEYCQGYVSKIKKENCDKSHRKWFDGVEGCALFYNQDRKKKTIVNAEQCESPFTTYVIHDASEGRDECLKPTAVQRLRGVANTAGKPFTAVASLPPKGVCKLQGGKMWSQGKCIKRSNPVDRDQGNLEDKVPSNNNQKYCENTLGRVWSNGQCSRSCKTPSHSITNSNNDTKWDYCYKGLDCSGEVKADACPAPSNPNPVKTVRLSCQDYNKGFTTSFVCPDENYNDGFPAACPTGMKPGDVQRTQASFIYVALICKKT